VWYTLGLSVGRRLSRCAARRAGGGQLALCPRVHPSASTTALPLLKQTGLWGDGDTARSAVGALYDSSGSFRISDEASPVRASKLITVTINYNITGTGCKYLQWAALADAEASAAGVRPNTYTFR
jgi:hypothetical protein